MDKRFYAHTKEGEPPENWQTLEEHLKNTARRAERFADVFGAGPWARQAGLWHDLGKYSMDFQNRLAAANDPDTHIEGGVSGRPDHSSAGAQHSFQLLGHAGKILAYAIAGHHAGLLDADAPRGTACLLDRLAKAVPDWSACPETLLKETAQLTLPFPVDRGRAGYQLSFFIRMLFSCLVDADFLDTEQFMDPERCSWRGGYPKLPVLEARLIPKLEDLSANAIASPVNRERRKILSECLEAAKLPPGLFSLSVPTGGGKTLSSLAFALRHARLHGLSRVIYAIPFTSIIEQNGEVFRRFLGDESVLEHHSNFEPEEEDRKSRLSSENWDVPLVLTTNVQFFESFFANRPSRCRKLHNTAKSVIILDEAQALPPNLLLPCLEVLRELTLAYGATVVLCTATQPALSRSKLFSWGLENVREIVADPSRLALKLKRTRVEFLGSVSDVEISEKLARASQVLCIVNTRKHAREVYEKIQAAEGASHLSALMCPAHRTQVLDEIRSKLKNNRPCRVVSTQLVEAGVDLDFPVVYRAFAGLDSLAQAAGRCNREGKMGGGGRVYVFEPEPGVPAGDFRQAAQAAREALRFNEDPLSLETVNHFFRVLYWARGEALDTRNILKELKKGEAAGNFAFRKVAEEFQMIDSPMEPVIVGYGEDGRMVMEGLERGDRPGYWARKAQRFSVGVYPYDLQKMIAAGDVKSLGGQFNLLINPALYTEDLGLCPEGPEFMEPGMLHV